MKKMLMLASCLLAGLVSWSQELEVASIEKSGLMVFEDKFDLYLIHTDETSLLRLMTGVKDTVEADVLKPRSGIYNLRTDLIAQTLLDSAIVLINQDYRDSVFEDSCKTFWIYGKIRYHKPLSYKLATQFKRIHYANRILVVKLEDYIVIEEFIP